MGVSQGMSIFDRGTCLMKSTLSSEIMGRRVGVDLSIWMYSFGRKYIRDIMLLNNHTNFISALLHAANVCRKFGSTMVFVADNRGTPFAPKAHTDDARRTRSAAYYAKYEATKEDKHLKASFKVSSALQNDVIVALRAQQFDVVIAPREADHQLALMYHEGFIFSVMSPDTDQIVLGVERLITITNIDQNDKC